MIDYEARKESEQLFKLFSKFVSIGSDLELVATRLQIGFEHINYPIINFIDASVDENDEVQL
jgi:hypothetical protein|tara:strand:+ start:1292 stop:1477 length:186 start_codon:yes stop_codon:yes gene_type:complete